MGENLGEGDAVKTSRQKLARVMAPIIFSLLVTQLAFAADYKPDIERLESKIIQGPSISDLVTYAYLTNPSIKAAGESWKAVAERYRVTTAYPDPQLLFTYSPEPIETRLGPQDWNINLSQTIPFPGKLTKAGELVEADAEIARLTLDKTLRDIIVKILESYHELLYILNAKKVVAQNLDLLNHLRKVGETSYAQDRTAFLDVVKAQSQIAQVQYDAILLEELEQTEKTQLNALLNRAPAASIGPLTEVNLRPLVYDLDEIYRLASKYQEEIQIAETKINKAKSRVDLARYENLPEFKLGLTYSSIGNPDVPVPPPDAGRDAIGVHFGVSIPLWFDKNEGRLSEAQAELRRAQEDKQTRVNETYAQVRSLVFRLRNSERLVRLYRDNLLPQAANSMEVAETWFREKQGSFSDFVETESIYYNFQLALARAKADYGKYLARLESLVGRNLTEKADNKIGKSREEGVR